MKLSKPPIVEAILHVVVEREGEFDYEKLNEYASYITENFPTFNGEERRFLKNEISFRTDDPHNINSSISNVLQGHRLTSDDSTKVIQSDVDNFSFSKLCPYETWESFHKEASEFFADYVEVTSASRVKRLGLRYLNSISIPFNGNPLKLQDYIKIFPEVSDDLSMSISGYFMQISLSSERYKPSMAIVNQTIGNMESKDGQKYVPLIFDIEVFQDVNLDTQDISIKSIFINNLRPFKNDIFLNGITEKTQELLK